MASQNTQDWSRLAPAPAAANGVGQPDRRQQLIGAQDNARHNPAFQQAKGKTHCNQATLSVVQSVGGPTAPLLDGHGDALNANQQTSNLAGSNLYSEVTPGRAQQIADQGGLVIAAYHNPHGHGHVATVRPSDVIGDDPTGRSGPLLNDIGVYDRVDRQSAAFRRSAVVRYYTPR